MRPGIIRIALTTVLLGFFSRAGQTGELSADLAAYLTAAPAEQKLRVIVRPVGGVDGMALKREVAAAYTRRADQHREALLAMQKAARVAQREILPVLGRLQLENRADNIKTYWIDNLIAADLTPAAIQELAAREDIEKIYPFPQIAMIRPLGGGGLAKPGAGHAEIGLYAIGADSLWALGLTGEGTLIATIDTGVDGVHPALSPKWRGNNGYSKAESWYDPVGGDSIPHTYGRASGNTNEQARYYHGTLVAGILVGHDPAAGETTGVAFDAQWISAAVMDVPGADIFEGLQWAIDPDGDPNTEEDVPDVINNSWGYYTIPGSLPPVGCDDLFWNIIDNLEAAGAVTIWSAGNEGTDPYSEDTTTIPQSVRNPANRITSDVNTFSVGMVDVRDYPNSLYFVLRSSRGPSNCDGVTPKPEVVAPGSGFRSTTPGGTYSDPVWYGTSFAAPYVSGAVALLREYNPNATVDTIKKVLLYSARDIDPAGDDNNTGMGLIDLPAALALMPANTEPHLYIKADTYTRPSPGETAEITVTVRNAGTPVDNVNLDLVALDSRLAVETGLVSLGSFNAGETKSNAGSPFRVSVAPEVKIGERLPVEWRFTGTGYSRTTRGTVAVGPKQSDAVFTHDIGNVIFTISSFGEYGLDTNGANMWRHGTRGFYHPRTGVTPSLFEMGFLVGTDSLHVSDAVRNTGVIPDDDFLTDASGNLRVAQPGADADQQTFGAFSDAHAENPLGLFIEQRTYAFADTTQDDYVILEYVIHNRSDSALSGVRAALFADWDFPWGENQAEYDSGDFDSLAGVGWMCRRGTTLYRGIAALTPDKMIAYRYITNDPVLYDGVSEAEKWHFMTARFDTVNTVTTGDASHIMTIGAFDIQPGDSAIAAFAVIGATKEAEMKTFARRARIKYQSILMGGLVVNPGELNFAAQIGGALPPAQTLTIEWGTEDTAWTVSHAAQWLEVSRSTGRTPDTIQVSVSDINFLEGEYHDTLGFSFSGGEHTTRVPVTLQITAAVARLRVRPQFVNFRAVQYDTPPGPETVWVFNDGFSDLQWTAVHDSVWLSVDPDSGLVAPGDSTEVTLAVGLPGRVFAPGDYRDTVTVSSRLAHDSVQQVAILFQVLSAFVAAWNEPNPFNPLTQQTEIHIRPVKRSFVEIYIYDLLGELVRPLYAAWVDAEEETQVSWDGRVLDGPVAADGVYLCRVKVKPDDGKPWQKVLKIAIAKR